MKIAAQVTGGPKIEVDYNLAGDLDGLVAQLGKEVVYSNAVDSVVIGIQALIRRHAKGTEGKDGKPGTPGKTQAEIQKLVDAYKPGVGAARQSPVDKIASLVGKMSAEDRAALLKSLKG